VLILFNTFPVDCEAVTVRIVIDALHKFDNRRRKRDDLPCRLETIRRVVELWLRVKK
jgi:hypothetical protein